MLPDSCLLRLVHDPPYTPIIEAQTVRVRRQLDEENEAEVYDGGWELRIAVEEHAKQILIDGISPLKASSEFRLVFLLVSLYVEDRNSGRMPAEYRTLSAQDLADASARTDDTSGRQAVSRLRRKISKEYKQLYGVALSLNALIENVHGKGYRLNPSVRVVAPDALKN
jgi:DNA-binding response OmpR family regulator